MQILMQVMLNSSNVDLHSFSGIICEKIGNQNINPIESNAKIPAVFTFIASLTRETSSGFFRGYGKPGSPLSGFTLSPSILSLRWDYVVGQQKFVKNPYGKFTYFYLKRSPSSSANKSLIRIPTGN